MAGSSGGTIARKVESLIADTVTGLGLRIWDVVFEKEGPDWYLRVLVDKADGSVMDTDTCAELSHAIDPILDEADPIEQSYYLEVGSPGLGRKLVRPEHFTACAGEKISVRLYKKDDAGMTQYEGILISRDKETLVIQTESGEQRIPCSAVNVVRLCDDEGLFDEN